MTRYKQYELCFATSAIHDQKGAGYDVTALEYGFDEEGENTTFTAADNPHVFLAMMGAKGWIPYVQDFEAEEFYFWREKPADSN